MRKGAIKNLINTILKHVDVRIVNAHWGPRGYQESFATLKKEFGVPKVIYDVGASNGSWSLDLKKIFPDSDYVLFEPLPKYAELLSGLKEQHSNFNYIGCGLGANNATLRFNEHDGQSSFLASEQWKGSAIDVPVKTLDQLVSLGECPAPNLIKADIQGFELEMLKGAETVLKACDFLFLELSWLQIYEGGPFAGEIMGYLNERGYRVYDICSYAMRPLDGRLTQSDVLFAHERTGLFAQKRWA